MKLCHINCSGLVFLTLYTVHSAVTHTVMKYLAPWPTCCWT